MDLDPGKVGRGTIPRGPEPGSPEARPRLAHAERVTLSDEAREASRDVSPPVLSDVRWYRVVNSHGRRHLAASGDDAGTLGSEASTPPPAILQAHPRTALRAYADAMARAA